MRFWKKKPIRLQVVRRDESKLRLTEWQMDGQLCAMAAKVLIDPNVQLMLSLMRNEHPSKHILPLGSSMDDRVVHQARAEGYEMALATLERMAVNLAPVPFPDAAFEPA